MIQLANSCPMQHILVTGGAGFIGSNFVHYIANHHEHTYVTVLDALTYAGSLNNLYDLPPSFANNHYQFIHGDIRDQTLVNSLLDPKHTQHHVPPIDTIVHFAAESHNDHAIENANPFLDTNIYGTYVLLEAARKFDIRFHHISTDEVYGDLPLTSTHHFTEESPYRPSSPYSASKAASDHLVRAWHRTYGLRTTISNCGNNYGARQHIEKFIPRQITNLLCGLPAKLYGNGTSVRDWIHVDDHCDAIWRILTCGTIGETYLIGAHCELSNREILTMLLELLDCDERCVEYVAPRPGEDIRYSLNTSKIEQTLNWNAQYTNIRQGLQETIDWYRNHRTIWEQEKNAVETHYAQSGH